MVDQLTFVASTVASLIVVNSPFSTSIKTSKHIPSSNRMANGRGFHNKQDMAQIARCIYYAHSFQWRGSTRSSRDPSVQLCDMAVVAPSSAPQVYTKQRTSQHLGSIHAMWHSYALPHNSHICCCRHVRHHHWGDQYLTNGKEPAAGMHTAIKQVHFCSACTTCVGLPAASCHLPRMACAADLATFVDPNSGQRTPPRLQTPLGQRGVQVFHVSLLVTVLALRCRIHSSRFPRTLTESAPERTGLRLPFYFCA